MKRPKLRLISVVVGVVAGAVLPPLPASAVTYRRYMWMQPPANAASSSSSSDKACLTQRRHSSSLEGNSKALDWNEDCSGVKGENVYFRTRAAAPNEQGQFIGARAEPAQSNSSCGGETLHRVRVRIRDTNTGVVKGIMSYQHTQVSTTSTLNILFQGGASFSGAKFNNFKIGDMVEDHRSTDCFTGFHVHENNTNTSLWDSWNTLYNSGSLGEHYEVDDKDTWTRRLHYDLVY